MKKKELSRVNARVASDDVDGFYKAHFPTLGSGAETVMAGFPSLYRRAIKEISGIFSPDELKLILDIHNGHAITAPALGSGGVRLSVADAVALDDVDKKWSVNADLLLSKIEKLTSFQEAALEIWATGFWHGKRGDDGPVVTDMDEWLKALSFVLGMHDHIDALL